MNFGEKPKKRITINITSLVDILIVLLLFFMLTTQFLHMEILNLNLSNDSKDSESGAAKSKTILVTLTGSGKFLLDGKEYNLLQLDEKIKPLLEKFTEAEIVVSSKKTASVQDVVTAIDSIKSSGGKNISLAEDIENAGK